jgi:hypothetical protein
MRRRGVAILVVVLALFLVWQFWPSGGGASHAAGPTLTPSPAGHRHHALGDGFGPNSPIKHVVFIVKENRTFNTYFATYGHGAVGSTTGGTLVCHGTVCSSGPDYRLKRAPDVQPHDITHGFSSGLYAMGRT